MAPVSKQVIFFLTLTTFCTFAISTATKDSRSWNYGGFNFTAGGGWPYKHRNATAQPSNRTIVVGGSDQNWRYGYNYQDWANQNAPFYFNDTLVFKYDPPNGSIRHSVYLLPNHWSFMKCDMRRAKMIGNVTQGAEQGLELVLKKGGTHYFACGEHDGLHCMNGMKFFVTAIMRWNYN